MNMKLFVFGIMGALAALGWSTFDAVAESHAHEEGAHRKGEHAEGQGGEAHNDAGDHGDHAHGGHHQAYVNKPPPPEFFKPFTEAIEVAGPEGKVTLSAKELNRGQKLYVQHCYACHGVQGDGKGPASAYLRPVPRDFRAGIFKFGYVTNEGLPHDQDMVALIQRGLTGSAMHPWDLTDQASLDIWNYIKTFSPRWTKTDKLGTRVVPTPDPWVGREAEAVSRGERVYHLNAQCRTCHPAYVTQEEFYNLAKEENSLWAYGELAYRAQLRPANKAWAPVKILPPDFLWAEVRSVAPSDSEKKAREQLFKVIGAGVGGAGMPTWKGALPDEDIWALSYYVNDLRKKRQKPEGYALRTKLDQQAAFTPPESAAGE